MGCTIAPTLTKLSTKIRHLSTIGICLQICLSKVECMHVYASWSNDVLAKFECMYLNSKFELFNNSPPRQRFYLNLSRLSTTRPPVSTFSDCFQTCEILIKFRQCSSLIVVTTLVNIFAGFSVVLIF